MSFVVHKARMGRIVVTCIIVASGMVSSACRTSKDSSTKDVLPFSVGEIEPILGKGYDSLVQEQRNGLSCVSGSPVKLSSGQATINLSQNIDAKDLIREFSGEVNGTPRLSFFEVGASVGYFRSLAKKDSVFTLTYAAKIQSAGDQLSNVSMTSTAKALDPQQMLETCGDSYVMQINRGGLLSIALSFDFGSIENRSRWQTKLKLSGALGDLAKELGNKVAKNSIEGTLTIEVHQVGGIPSEALTSAKTCSLSSADEFADCKKRMEELIAYATGAFPKQIESNPGVLNFTTAPLRNLGAQITARVPDDILQMRQQLDELNRKNIVLSDMLLRSRQVGLSLDAEAETAVNANTAQIKQAATACFSYQAGIPAGTQDWSECRRQVKDISTSLKPVNAELVNLRQLDIVANSEVGNSIFNSSDSKMIISYVLASGREWKFDPTRKVSSDGDTAGGAVSGVLSSSDKQGALLTRTDQSYARTEASGQVEIFPGEALGFVMNDTIGGFADNSGYQTIYWRCVNCNSKMKQLPTYRLRVKANAEGGTAFTSRENLTGTYRVVAYGQWRAASSYPISDAAGSRQVCGESCPDPLSNLQVLVMSAGPGTPATAVGRDKTLAIQANKPMSFLMNEQARGYADNQGTVELILQCKRCDISSHAIILDTE